MKMRSMISVVLICSVGLAGCAANGGLSHNQTTGAGIGCLLGAVIGMAVSKNKALGASAGCVAGGAVGLTIGSALDEKEKRQLTEASLRAATNGKTGQRVNWGASVLTAQATPATAPTPTKKGKKSKQTTLAMKSGSKWVVPETQQASAKPDPNAATGWVIPVNDAYVASNGQTCRDLQQVAVKQGKTYQQNIRACKTGNSWTLPSEA